MNFRHDPSMEPLFTVKPSEGQGRGCVPPQAAFPLEMPLVESAPGPLVPKPYRIMQNIASVSACVHQNAALDRDGVLWTWGPANMTKMENGSYSPDCIQDVDYCPKARMEDVMSIAQGAWHTLCITKDGRLWSLTQNTHGALGTGTRLTQIEPIYIMDECVSVFAADEVSFAIRSDNSLWGWGRNEWGILMGPEKYVERPKKLLDSVIRITAGEDCAMVVRTDHSLWGWGGAFKESIIKFDETITCKPILIAEGVQGAAAAICAANSSYFMWMEDGDLYSIRHHGPGTMVSWKQRRDFPTGPIKVLKHVADMSAGNMFVLIRLQDNRLVSMGWNDAGQCGTGRSSGSVEAPRVILNHVIGMAAAHTHGMGLQENGDLWIWGGQYGRTDRKKQNTYI